MGFSSAYLFPAMKLEAVTQGGTRGIDHLKRKKTQGAGIFKGWGGIVRKRGKTGKQGKVGVKRKWCFSSASPFPAWKQEAITLGGIRGIDHQTRRKTQRLGGQARFHIHSRKIRIKRVRGPDTPTIDPILYP